MSTNTDSHRGTRKHTRMHMIQYLKEMWGDTKNHFVTIYP